MQYSQITVSPRVPVAGSAIRIIRDTLGFALENATRGADMVAFDFFGLPMLQLNHPDLVKYVLVDNHKNYNKGELYLQFESALGKGLLTSEGEKWRRDRQTIQPMFKRELLENLYCRIIGEVTRRYRDDWRRKCQQQASATVDFSVDMGAITMEIILKCVFGSEGITQQEIDELHEHYLLVLEYLKDMRLLPRVDFHKVFYTPAYRRFRHSLEEVERLYRGICTRCQQNDSLPESSMLKLLWHAQAAQPELFGDQEIRDQIVTMVFAGFETTSNAMQWMWYLLDQHPQVTERLRGEIAQAGKGSDVFTAAQLAEMPLLTGVFKEALRLAPPFWLTGRGAVQDDVIGGYPVKRNTVIWLPQISLHRDARWWQHPNAFLPERFTGDLEQNLPIGAYFPFSHGPRKCSGLKFAELEAKIIFATLLPEFDVAIPQGAQYRFDPHVTLKFNNPLKGRISLRSSASAD